MRTTEQRVIRTLAEQMGMDEDYIASTPKSAWGMDSLDEIEIVMALEDEFGIEIPDEIAEGWKDAAAATAYVTSLQSA